MEPEATLKDWVRQHRVMWEIGPSQELVEHRPQAVGFELRLFGRHGSHVQPSPGCPECVSLHDRLRAIAEAHDIDVTIEPLRREVRVRRSNNPPETIREVVFTAERGGKFRYRCSKTCGVMHPFMVGELIVGPNWLLRVSSLAAVGLLVGGFVWVWQRAGREDSE